MKAPEQINNGASTPAARVTEAIQVDDDLRRFNKASEDPSPSLSRAMRIFTQIACRSKKGMDEDGRKSISKRYDTELRNKVVASISRPDRLSPATGPQLQVGQLAIRRTSEQGYRSQSSIEYKSSPGFSRAHSHCHSIAIKLGFDDGVLAKTRNILKYSIKETKLDQTKKRQ
ncbi:hypothetical protein EVAR_77008_1 [Eumeta japonica]|uniref:Uncharacterized protein n=1 Tax=Eumeta variegata TaxID=151549 RepID=A0A4C1SI54_EUMVA|nr:hypothetical protein EVAR_77008_1 [Eumeta japonica]